MSLQNRVRIVLLQLVLYAPRDFGHATHRTDDMMTQAEFQHRARASAARSASSWCWSVLAVVAYVALRSSRPAAARVRRPAAAAARGGRLAQHATPPPRDEALRGKVVLVDCWVSRCPPVPRRRCRIWSKFYKQVPRPGRW